MVISLIRSARLRLHSDNHDVGGDWQQNSSIADAIRILRAQDNQVGRLQ